MHSSFKPHRDNRPDSTFDGSTVLATDWLKIYRHREFYEFLLPAASSDDFTPHALTEAGPTCHTCKGRKILMILNDPFITG